MIPRARAFGAGWRSAALAAACALALAGCAEQMGRGSARSIYTVADVMDVYRQDLEQGKSAQMRLMQQMLLRLEKDPSAEGRWEFVGCTPGILLLQSETPRLAPEQWGVLLQARGYGRGELRVRYVPSASDEKPREYTLEVQVTR